MLPCPLTYFEMQRCYQIDLKFNDVHPRNNLPKIKDREYAINLDEHKLIGTHWMTLYVNINIIRFDIFGAEYIKKEIKKLIGNKNIKTNICEIPTFYSIM